MLSPDRIPNPMPLAAAAADYDVVRKAIGHIRGHWREQPEIEAIAEAASVTPTELHHLFRRWAGLTPKAFLQALTLDGARQLLRDSASVLDATYEVGLSGPGRLHDLFVTHEAMSPGEWKSGGEGDHPFWLSSVAVRQRAGDGDRARACRPAFADHGEERAALNDMKSRWPRATYVEDSARTAVVARRIFDPSQWQADQPLRVVLIGTDFEVRVWDALLQIPMGKLTTYSNIAAKSVQPTASRAVGAAVGKNPVRSWCRAIASSANPATSPAITGASPASARCSAGKPGRLGRRRNVAAFASPQPARLAQSQQLIDPPAVFAEGFAGLDVERARRGQFDPDIVGHARRPRRQHDDAGAEKDRLGDAVGDEDDRLAALLPDVAAVRDSSSRASAHRARRTARPSR